MMINRLRPISLTLRVVLFVIVTVIFCLSLIVSLINSSINHHFVQQDGNEIEVINSSIEHVLSQQFDSQEELVSLLSEAVNGHHGVYYQINSQKGKVLYSNSSRDFSELVGLLPSALGFDSNNIKQQQMGKFSYRVLVSNYNYSQYSYKIIVAIDMSFHMQFLSQFRQSLLVIVSGSGLLVIIACWFAVYQGLNPLRGLSKKMQDIETNNIEVRLDEQKVPIELADMVRSFNLMLARLQEGFDSLSNFSSDIAHELRTPLTNIVTQTQVGLSRQRALPEYQELLFSNLEELERLTKMVSDMLLLAKTQNGLIKPAQQILMSHTEFDALFEYFDALAEEAGVKFRKEGIDLAFYCDKLHFRQLLSNLLSNALRYSPKGTEIVIAVRKLITKQIEITVVNPGEAIAPEYLPYLFDRFYRADKSRQRHSDGAGLGLAIVKAIVEANGGKISVVSNSKATSFTVLLNLV